MTAQAIENDKLWGYYESLREFPELKGEPEVGKWYEIRPDGAKASDGGEWHGVFRKSSENKVVVYFFGGDGSINEERYPYADKGMNVFMRLSCFKLDFFLILCFNNSM